MAKVFANCDKCNREIYYGDNYVALAKNIEKAISLSSSDDKQVQILDSELLLTICSNCAVLLHYDLSSALNKIILVDTSITRQQEEKILDLADFDANGRDPLFQDAARIVVQNQIGSTSLIQRRMKLGYNRAGRLMDQLEAAGVVGPNMGSKAREVILKTEAELNLFLARMSI